MKDTDFNFLILCTFRYCLGRRTYAPSYFKDILKENLSIIDRNTRNIILKEIEEETNLGDNCDITTWREVEEILKFEWLSGD